MSSSKSTETSTNDSENKPTNDGNNKFINDNNKTDNTKTPLSHYIIHDAFTVLVSEHASLADTHNTLSARYRSLERDLRWYSDTLVAVHADCRKLECDYQELETAYRALEAERDNAARQGLRARRGPFGGRLWGREKMGEVWRMQGEFVWVKVEERGWVRMAKGGVEGVKGCGRKVNSCLGEAREKCREMSGVRRRRSVVPVGLRSDLSL